MSFNLRYMNQHDKDNAWPYRKDAAAHIIRTYRPTLVGTQEGFASMLADLQERLPEYGWFGEGRNGGVEGEYNAIFYNKTELDVIDWGQFWLSEHPHAPVEISWNAKIHRICTWGLFRFRERPDKQFLHFNTHLDHMSQLAREKGSLLVWNRLSEQCARMKLPAVLTGDLNAEPDNAVIRFLRGEVEAERQRSTLTDAYLAAGVEAGRTFHGFEGGVEGEPIDYVFVSPEASVRQMTVIRDVVDGRLPSDHYPVQAVVFL
ncbi:MAG: endonuclease/exonuclease/phosphatase [Paenibacillus sp.]|nr:endonuclease/exonuclease/phosphatase [Paenibacillus sp.]